MKSFSLVLLLGLISAQGAALAGTVQEAQALITTGDASYALTLLDAYLAKQPKDAQARFARAMAMSRLNRDPEAISIYSELIHDVPQFPEPYNNLAILLVKSGDYGKARAVLESGVARNPGYAKAQANLADIYLLLAAQALRAAQLKDMVNPILRTKLELLQGLVGPMPEGKPTPGHTTAISSPARPIPLGTVQR